MSLKDVNILEKQMSNLHEEIAGFISEVEFWDTELSVFQGIIESKGNDGDLMEKIRLFKTEKLQPLKSEIYKEEQQMANLLESNDPGGREAIQEHTMVNSKFIKISSEYKQLKTDLVKQLEKIIKTK